MNNAYQTIPGEIFDAIAQYLPHYDLPNFILVNRHSHLHVQPFLDKKRSMVEKYRSVVIEYHEDKPEGHSFDDRDPIHFTNDYSGVHPELAANVDPESYILHPVCLFADILDNPEIADSVQSLTFLSHNAYWFKPASRFRELSASDWERIIPGYKALQKTMVAGYSTIWSDLGFDQTQHFEDQPSETFWVHSCSLLLMLLPRLRSIDVRGFLTSLLQDAMEWPIQGAEYRRLPLCPRVETIVVDTLGYIIWWLYPIQFACFTNMRNLRFRNIRYDPSFSDMEPWTTLGHYRPSDQSRLNSVENIIFEDCNISPSDLELWRLEFPNATFTMN
jgi:hypothetical protein